MIKQIRKGKLGIYGEKEAAREIGRAYDAAKAQGKSDLFRQMQKATAFTRNWKFKEKVWIMWTQQREI